MEKQALIYIDFQYVALNITKLGNSCELCKTNNQMCLAHKLSSSSYPPPLGERRSHVMFRASGECGMVKIFGGSLGA